MKSIFKKNQIIIAALAIMIMVAGYLNFTKDNIDDKIPNQAVDSSSEGEEFVELNDDLYADISDEDVADSNISVSDMQNLVVNENTNTATETANNEGEVATDKTGTETANAGEEANAEQEVASPGEAILASTSLTSGYFSNAKLTREQIRAKNKETLMSVISDANVSDDQKQAALDSLLEMTSTAEKENAAEILLEAKGFEGAVVSMIDGTVDVVVNSESITDAQVAQIEDIVTRKTGADVSEIRITSVIVED